VDVVEAGHQLTMHFRLENTSYAGLHAPLYMALRKPATPVPSHERHGQSGLPWQYQHGPPFCISHNTLITPLSAAFMFSMLFLHVHAPERNMLSLRDTWGLICPGHDCPRQKP
jgi:hypothetical protein